MALGPCRECREEVSSEAASCPHCGVPTPTRSAIGEPLMTRPGGPFSKPTPLTLSPTVVKATTKRSQIRLPIVFISLVVLSLLVVVALSYGFSRRVSSASPSAALKDSNPPATASSESPPRLGAGERHAA